MILVNLVSQFVDECILSKIIKKSNKKLEKEYTNTYTQGKQKIPVKKKNYDHGRVREHEWAVKMKKAKKKAFSLASTEIRVFGR